MRTRSSAPSAVMKSLPNFAAMSGIAAPPGAVLEREIASASITAAPSSASICRTVLLPLPIPPVRPMRSAIAAARSQADGLQDRLRAEQHRRQPGAGEERTEWHVAAFAQAAGDLHADAHDGA